MSSTPAPHTWIDTPTGLAPLVDALAGARFVALDSESNSLFVHKEQVCLIQLNVDDALFVIDPIALGVAADAVPSAVLAPLQPGLARTDRPLFLHGGEYDVACLGRDFGLRVGGVWDTQQAASLLGHSKTGYGSLVERYCGVVLGKAFATHDWKLRPVPPAALAYALDDVVHLPVVARALQAEVEAAGIVDEVAVAASVVEAATWSGGFDADGFFHLRGVEALPPTGLRALRRLWAWRHAAAAAEDVPAGRLVNNEVLLHLARHPPLDAAALGRSRLKPRVAKAHGKALLDAMAQAAADPLPQQPAPRAPGRVEQARESRLKQWRKDEAERRSAVEGRPIPLQLVLPARALAHVKSHGVADVAALAAVPQLGAGRIARYGETLVRLCGT